MSAELRVLAAAEVSLAIWDQIHALDRRIVWSDDGRQLTWSQTRNWVVLAFADGMLASHVGIVLRDVLIDGVSGFEISIIGE